MAKNKIRADRVIILILVAILVGGALGFGVYKIIELFSNDKQIETKPVETIDGTRLSLNDYTIYYDDTNDLGFNFIIANITFSNDKNISYDLSNLQTSEKIFLNNISKYINKLDSSGYDISRFNLQTRGIVCDSNIISVNIFVPFSTNGTKLSIYNSIDTSNCINFDLNKDAVAVTTLKLNDNNDEIVIGNTTVFISKAYISTFMLHNDEPYELGSTTKVYSFEITAKDVKDNVTISDAIFLPMNSSDEIRCLSSDYKSIDMDNIIDKKLELGTKGGLFFDVHTNNDTVEDGVLLIKFSNSNDWIKISTEAQ